VHVVKTGLGRAERYVRVELHFERRYDQAFVDRSTDQVLLSVNGLPALPGDRVYQLWFTRPDNVLESGDTFRVAADGSGMVLATGPGGLSAYVGSGITTGPAAGSRSPTTPMVI
jgi:hypothetical protein